MDAFLYTAVSGADYSQKALAVRANNLANAQTPGFRADLSVAEPLQIEGYGYDARLQAAVTDTVVDQTSAHLSETGRPLDMAIQGNGYFTVQTEDGIAYSRAGNFALDDQGAMTLNGHPVLGDGGPVVLPQYAALDIGADGSVSVQAPGTSEMQVVDRLTLVAPEPADLFKRADGLLGSRAGIAYGREDGVRVVSGHLEDSNVSAIEEMMQTMQLSRTFEMQMRMFRSADEMADSGNRLIRG
ncbi:flagellar basal body rod protein FlgF [Xanthomonas campestris pv. phormiicola]|nr:flagellar basal body rod protein FlgF [Xanthomonas campestris pv. phormiicola]UYC17844.1 flagellar basal body rod protein FlgF [Xanthomonas campestris pv. phormiicola]